MATALAECSTDLQRLAVCAQGVWMQNVIDRRHNTAHLCLCLLPGRPCSFVQFMPLRMVAQHAAMHSLWQCVHTTRLHWPVPTQVYQETSRATATGVATNPGIASDLASRMHQVQGRAAAKH